MSRTNPRGPATWDSPAYIEYCEKHTTRVKLRYPGFPDWHVCCLVARYKRDHQQIQRGMIMSASSGPKDYFINDVIACFENEAVTEVACFVLNRVPFILRKCGPLWFDSRDRIVEVMGNATVSS